LFWCDTAEYHVGPVVLVGPQSVSGKFLDFVERLEQVMGKPIIAKCPVVARHISVLSRLPKLNEIDADAAFCCPSQVYRPDVFRTVVTSRIARVRTAFYNAASAANPMRWASSTRKWLPTKEVHLNLDHLLSETKALATNMLAFKQAT
jgi:hypothetical protein